jgi:hypothetical protein
LRGLLRDVRIYRKALSVTEIQEVAANKDEAAK